MNEKISESAATIPEQIIFGKVIEGLRAHAGMSQSDLATISGISNAALSRLERGESNPTLTTILALARGLSLPPHQLMKANDLAMESARERLSSGSLGALSGAGMAAGLAFLGGTAAAKAVLGRGSTTSNLLAMSVGAAIGTGVFAALATFLDERNTRDHERKGKA